MLHPLSEDHYIVSRIKMKSFPRQFNEKVYIKIEHFTLMLVKQ